MTPKRLRAIHDEQERFGARKDESLRAIRATLAAGVRVTRAHASVVIHSDEKLIYPAEFRRAWGAGRVVHRRTNSRVRRDTRNPLFPINHTEAMMRDLMGRLRRRSWLVSKDRRFLDLALQLHVAYRNYVRKRFNHDDDHVSCAQALGILPRRLRPSEVLGWRQDWGSISPFSLGRRLRTSADVIEAYR